MNGMRFKARKGVGGGGGMKKKKRRRNREDVGVKVGVESEGG